ncbi:unnamed protein product [Linum tenue]|uniref:DUF7725 domain-containing protein n=1 Tax=Linum tenue TaxID=586396 RepID=A0AAV0IKI3_9ROSI|nr:unnamed protein product [Linum tenue]
MEAAAGVAASRGGSLPMSSSSRKEWRAVSDHHSARNPSDEVQHGREPVDVDFCSINVDGSLDNDILRQRVHSFARQREELQQMEIELRAQMIARSEILEIQNSFDAQIKEREDSSAQLQEKLHEREQAIHDLERRIEEMNRELHAVKLDNEAAWAKEDLLREQNKELATFRRERDHSEAEKAQHMQQLHEFQEHIQDKERQILELQEQRRVDQETIYLKDEQLKVWIARVQEMDALQSNLQAELRERIEQYNQLWLGCQRQFIEMERLHVYTIQQLQVELADRTGSYPDESRLSQTNSKDSAKLGQTSGNQLVVNGSGASNANNGAHSNGSADSVSSFASSGNAANQTNNVAGMPISSSSLLGMPTYIPPGQMTALHPFILHQQGIPQSMPSHVHPSQVGHFHSVPAMSSLPQWQAQQAATEASHISTQDQLTPSQSEQNLDRSETKYYDMSVNGQGYRSDYLDVHINQGAHPDSVISSSSVDQQVLESIDRSYLVGNQPDQNLQHISVQFSEALRLNSLEQKIEPQEQNVVSLANDGLQRQIVSEEQQSSAVGVSLPEASVQSASLTETVISNGPGTTVPEAFTPTGQANIATAGKALEPPLIDERSLLACIVRTIPAGGRIRINSTLPNRLGKMLAPLHWHDYKKKYGKLDDFVAGHPELFLIEGEYIQLREGAQEMIAATAAVAKVAAAAAASSTPYSSFSTMSLTPMAQSHRAKKFPSTDSNHLNGVSFGATGGMSNVKILSKLKDNSQETNAGADLSGSGQSKVSSHARPNSSFVGKQQGRVTGNVPTSRR